MLMINYSRKEGRVVVDKVVVVDRLMGELMVVDK